MRVLIISDGPNIMTGYGQIARGFGKYLARSGVDIAFGSLQQMGGELYARLDGDRYATVYSCYGGQAPYVERAIAEYSPDLVVHIRDPVALTQQYFPGAYRLKPVASRYNCRVIHWAPVMGEVPADVVRALAEDSDLVLAPTRYAYGIYLYGGLPSNLMETLYWGVDHEIYYPDEGDRELIGASADSFLMGTVGVHDRSHKNYPLVMKVVSELVRRGHKVELYMHTASGSFHLEHYSETFGIKGRVIRPRIYLKDWGVSDALMRRIYCTLDCYISLSSAEGFNMPANEAAFCRRPVVLSDHPVHREIMGDLTLLVKSEPVVPDNMYMTYLADTSDAASKIEGLIRDGWSPDEDKIQAHVKKLSWPTIVEKFLQIVRGRFGLK
jgi:glycosyltransferase involved in cell wall biosynthesis